MGEMYPVKPLYAEYCQNCMHNGCYPWNRHPFLLCMNMGGLLPPIELMDEDVSHQCLQYKPVTFDIWNSHFQDLKAEAEEIERTRLKAMTYGISTNQILPAEYIESKLKEEG